VGPLHTGAAVTKKKKQDEALDPLQEGLISFYSSQADLMLAQYKNINQLLGPTRDWSHPGSHCEVLLRDFLRRNLLQWMNVDKGYIYGRVADGSTTAHCPEIDVLIHNVKDYAPVFRLGEFVIVQPEAVLGIIQVKRAFKKVAGTDPLDKGLQQVMGAKQHLLDLLMQKRPKKAVAPSIADLNRSVFSAVIAFEKASDVPLRKAILARFNYHLSEKRFGETEMNHNASMAVLPTFVGSLSGFSAFARRNYKQQTYHLYDAEGYRSNLSLQLLLYNLMSELMEHYAPLIQPFAFPTLKDVRKFKIPPDK
jgi:hypothetical protein